MQIFVIGMHRSGTSITTRLLNLMGAYFGPEGISTGANEENPKGFWERRDVRTLNDMILHSTQAEWYRINNFSLDKIPENTGAEFHKKASRLILELDAHRPWVLKEPRFCLTFPLWREHLEFPVCIYVHRSPIQIAQSLKTRNGFPLQFGVSLWEKYTIEALKITKNCPKIFILHSTFLAQPIQAVANLYEQLTALGCQGLRIPHDKEILAFVEPDLHRQKGSSDFEAGFINKQQATLIDAFESGQILDIADTTDFELSPGAQEILGFYEEDFALKNEHQCLEGAMENLQASEAALQQERAQLKTSVQSLEGSLRAKEASEAALQQERAQLKTSVQSLEGSLRAKEVSEAALQQERAQLKTSVQSLEGSLRAKEVSEAALQQERAQLKTSVQSLEEILRAKETSEAALRRENEQNKILLQNREKSLTQELDQLKGTAEAQQKALRQELKQSAEQKDALLRNTEQRYEAWLRQLEQDAEALFASWRWRVGCFIVRIAELALLRWNVCLTADHMRKVFNDIRLYEAKKKQNRNENLAFKYNPGDFNTLIEWIQLLKKDFEALLCSKRWQVGNALICFPKIIFSREIRASYTDNLNTIFTEFESWLPRQKNDEKNIHILINWLNQIDSNFNKLFASKPWRLGHFVISIIEQVIGRGHPYLAADDIKKIILNYHGLKQNLSFTKTPLLISEQSSKSSKEFTQRKNKDYRKSSSVNIIVYTKGKRSYLRKNLLSISKNSDRNHNSFYLIDDSQHPIPIENIAEWSNHLPIKIIRPQTRDCFLLSLCEVIQEIGLGDFCIIQDHVILTPDWLPGLNEAAYSSKSVGIVSPITPTHPTYSFKMKSGDNAMTCAKKLRLVTQSEFPQILMADPAIFYIKYSATRDFISIAKSMKNHPLIVLLTSISLALLKKNLITVLADNTYIHVGKSLEEDDSIILEQLSNYFHGKDLDLMRDILHFTNMQGMVSQNDYYTSDIKLVNQKTLVIFFSTIQIAGGIIILVELANDLILSGVDVISILMHPHWKYTPEMFELLLFEPIKNLDINQLAYTLPEYSMLLATMWITARPVADLAKLNQTFKPYYFIQDYEPLFYNPEHPAQKAYYQEALESYHLNLSLLSTSDWIIKRVRNQLQSLEYDIKKVAIGIDQEVFYDHSKSQSKKEPLRLIAMTRFHTPRRGFENLIKTLSIVHEANPSIQFVFFGDDDLSIHKIPFPYKNLGIIKQSRLREEYLVSHIFVDLSLFQGFGLPALEAMICGCACVLTDSGGISEYARHDVNSVLVPVGDNDAAARAILMLASNNELRQWIADQGQQTANQFSLHNTARDIGGILEEIHAQRSQEVEIRCSDSTRNIIVPIYNEIHVVKLCLESIVKYTELPYRVFLVDDCSDQYTAQYLKNFAHEYEHFNYLRNEQNLGFVGSVNVGMRATPSGDIILLNSDTIVTPGWLNKLTRCAQSDDKIGIISPLSTRSSHLWVKINPGDSIFDTASAIEKISNRDYPDIVTPEGWCFYIKRNVYEHLGGFDPVFGRGYCEESDYCMRAFANGYRTVCCDDTFIFHEGMVTFKEERGPRYEKNRAIFDQRWKPLYQKIYPEFLADNPLGYLRNKYGLLKRSSYRNVHEVKQAKNFNAMKILDDPTTLDIVDHYISNLETFKSDAKLKSVVFLIHELCGFGGVISIIQLANDMIFSGINVKIVVMSTKGYKDDMGSLTKPIFYSDLDTLIKHFPKADVLVGTLWITMYYLVKIIDENPNSKLAYFVQDYEPDFYKETEIRIRDMIKKTYKITPYNFAKTHWICEKVKQDGGKIALVSPALELDLFYPRDIDQKSLNQTKSKKLIVTILRPSTPQRGFDTALKTLNLLSKKRNDFEVHSFGCTNEELKKHSIAFSLVNHGILPNNKLPSLYSKAYIFAEFSDFHGFGRTIAEAMACKTACVITDSGGISLFARHGINALVAPPKNAEELAHHISVLLDDEEFRNTLANNARNSVVCFDRMESCKQTIKFLNKTSATVYAPHPLAEEGLEVRVMASKTDPLNLTSLAEGKGTERLQTNEVVQINNPINLGRRNLTKPEIYIDDDMRYKRLLSYGLVSRSLMLTMRRIGYNVTRQKYIGLEWANIAEQEEIEATIPYRHNPEYVIRIGTPSSSCFTNTFAEGIVDIGITGLGRPWAEFEVDWATNLRNVGWAICVQNKYDADMLREHSYPRVEIVAHGIDHKIFNTRSRKPHLPFTLCYVGSLHKGGEVLMQAFDKFSELHAAHETALIIAGYVSGANQEDIKKQYKTNNQRVELHYELLSLAQIAAIYERSDVFVTASQAETWCLPIVEAAACGLPSITLVNVGRSEYLTPGQDCFELEHITVEAIAEMMEYCYQHREIVAECGKAAIQMAQRFTWDRAAREYLRILGID
ncbi:MAG: glycosyltransferase [Candidatus Competibacteraceae bacterium]|nr:MAG: glycosyltransferase [Candidatus Competibacteraceae bacterium]